MCSIFSRCVSRQNVFVFSSVRVSLLLSVRKIYNINIVGNSLEISPQIWGDRPEQAFNAINDASDDSDASIRRHEYTLQFHQHDLWF